MSHTGTVSTAPGRADLRMPLLGSGAWAGGLVGQLAPASVVVVTGSLLGIVLVLRWRVRGASMALLTATGVVLVAAAVACAAMVRVEQTREGPLADLARERATASVVATVISDPRPLSGGFEERVAFRVRVTEVVGRGEGHRLRTPLLVVADPDWAGLPLGATVLARGRLGPPRDPGLAGTLSPVGSPVVVSEPDPWWRGAAAVRASLRESVAHRPADQRVLVPAMVNGDDAGLDPALAEDFRTTGLTHLLAVSGTNLTLLVGFLLVLARWCGVRGRGLYAVAGLGIVGFVLLARTEPSVLRAAAMGSVALLAMGTAGRRRGARALGVALVVLLLLDPGLAVSIGFALSVLATGGILLLAPVWRDALGRWMPRWLAEAIAVPAAAQLACTPLVAAISGQVSLVAVAANLLVVPAVGPATVLGLAGALLGLVTESLGRVGGTLAAWCVAWIIAVARHGAGLPTAAVDWASGPLSLALLTVLCVAMAVVAPWVLRRRGTGVACLIAAGAAVVVRPPSPGWPPADWVLVACDVGQGDGLVLNAGGGRAVVVDAGPEPDAMDRCLDELAVESVPLVLLSHFHADHVDGLEGVGRGRRLGVVVTAGMLDPHAGVATVESAARSLGVPLRLADAGVRRVGDVTLQVLTPRAGPPRLGPGDGSEANDASVVALVEVRGVRILLTGDLEPPGQARVARTFPGLHVDVLKVPHHGSRFQDLDFLTGLGAEVAVVSAGEGNDYGHPAPDVLAALERAGTQVARTDRDGAVAVVRDGSGTVRVDTAR